MQILEGIEVIELSQLGGIVSPSMVGRVTDLTSSTTPALYAIGAARLVCPALLIWALPARCFIGDLSVPQKPA